MCQHPVIARKMARGDPVTEEMLQDADFVKLRQGKYAGCWMAHTGAQAVVLEKPDENGEEWTLCFASSDLDHAVARMHARAA